MHRYDDQLEFFEAFGAHLPPNPVQEGYVNVDGARIYYCRYGVGEPILLLHGGLGHGGNWAYQVPFLTNLGYSVIVPDTRGHGRSTRDARPFSYELLAEDLRVLCQTLCIGKTSLIGWSDGAVTALIFADTYPDKVRSLIFFGCNTDPSGLREIADYGGIIGACFRRHRSDYAILSSTPSSFDELVQDVSRMQKEEPNYSAADLSRIRVPVTVLQSEHDEFIRMEHAVYLADTIPNARLTVLADVSHFAPLQRPSEFNAACSDSLARMNGIEY